VRAFDADDEPDDCYRAGEGPSCFKVSWLTLAELLAFDWDMPDRGTSVVDASEYAAWVADGRSGGPDSHVSEVPPSKLISEEAMAALVASGVRAPEHGTPVGYVEVGPTRDAGPFCEVAWSVPVRWYMDEFVRIVIHRLHALGAPEDVRLVFWFNA
jgi:hypothetical protein